MHPKKLVFAVLPLLSIVSAPALAGGAMLFKLGGMHLMDDRQSIDFVERDFDATSKTAYGIQLEHRFKKGIAIGVEYNFYRHEYSPPSSPSGTAETRAIMVSAKKYFGNEGVLHPYFGFGIGIGRTNVDHGGLTPYTDEELTTPIQFVAGLEFRVDNLSFLVEAKHIHHEIESGGNEYNPTATGVFAGFGFNW